MVQDPGIEQRLIVFDQEEIPHTLVEPWSAERTIQQAVRKAQGSRRKATHMGYKEGSAIFRSRQAFQPKND
jgi:hypothetical protein